MAYSIQDIALTIHAQSGNGQAFSNATIHHLLTDSRKLVFPESSLFFALSSPRKDGHQFLAELYAAGVRNFVVTDAAIAKDLAGANLLAVENVLDALQTLAKTHRGAFPNLPVIGITGSNGKTMVKEWLNLLLQKDHQIVRSPRSYNSQIGVPLSVWQIMAQDNLGIFEAGISQKGEMASLAKIIQPTMGVLTNLGEAHAEGFSSRLEKLQEKLHLFHGLSKILVALDALSVAEQAYLQEQFPLAICWSRKQTAQLQIQKSSTEKGSTLLTALYEQREVSIRIPFSDPISIDNAITCWLVLLQMQYPDQEIAKRMALLEPVEMRMQLKNAINHCYLINDSYSNDLSSLSMALAYLKQQAGDSKTTLILSDIPQTGADSKDIYEQVALELAERKIHQFIGIGPAISAAAISFQQRIPNASFYSSTADFLERCNAHQFQHEYILLKGARVFAFEQISKWLEQQQHQTLMEINLNAMVHNLKAYQARLQAGTKVMAMVKAFSYGSGSVEVARLLEFHQVNYLAVAYADEGIALRQAGIRLPIMVMSPDETSFDALVNAHLEPELFSFGIYQAFHEYLLKQGLSAFPVHLKFNTGMNRLGFETTEAAAIAHALQARNTMQVKSVFSHLAGSEQAGLDAFTLEQASLFEHAAGQVETILAYPILKHISNTAAIFRYPQLQYQMVRLGIGLYGVDPVNEQVLALQPVSTLKSTIAQIRTVAKGQSVGYGRNAFMEKDSLIATIRIGYADGFGRELGNGRAAVWVRGQLAPVVGNVCMDMTMIDVTGIRAVQEGDQVEIFGTHLPVQELAKWAGTIPYEILTGISQRVKRVYLEE
jgi:Alr-MurF fusion protein